jgi:hypothetical protein
MNQLSNNQFTLKMQHKTSFCVRKCSITLPSPLPSPHEERVEYSFQSLPLGGDLEGQAGNIAMQFQCNMEYTVNQVCDNLNFLKIAKRCKELQKMNLKGKTGILLTLNTINYL